MTVRQSTAALNAAPRALALLLGLCVAALALSVLAGWLLDIPILRNALRAGSPMRANAALAMLSCGVALAVLALGDRAKWARIVASILGGAVFVLCSLTLSQDLAGWDLGIDQWLVTDATESARSAVPGRMSPPASFSLMLVSAALLVASFPIPAFLRMPILSALVLTVLLVGGVASLGHLFERLAEFRFLSYSRIAAYSAIGLVLLGAGLFALLRAEGTLAWSLDKTTTAAYGVGMAAMVATAGISYQFTSQMRIDVSQVMRTQEVMREIQRLGVHLGDFTISAGRYLITRDERTLDGRDATKAAVQESLDRLRAFVELPGQAERIDRIDRLHARRIAMSDDIIAAFRERIRVGQLPAAGEPSPLGSVYPALGVEIDGVVRTMELEAYNLLDRRQKQSEATSRRTFLLLPMGVFVALTLLSFGLFSLNAAVAGRQRAQSRLLRRGERLAVLHEIDLAIIEGRSPAQIAAAALPRLRDLLRLPRVVVNLFDLEKGEAEWLVAIGRHRTHVAPGIRYSMDLMGDQAALKRGETQLIDVAALRHGDEMRALLASGVRWYMVAPMLAGGELIGGLSFGGPSREFRPEQVEIAREMAAQFAIAIERSRLAERVREADAHYRLLFENVPVGVTMTGPDGRILSANAVAARMLGYGSVTEAIAGLRNDAARVYADPGVRDAYLRGLREHGTVRGMEVELVRRDGSRFWATMDGKLILDPQGRPLLLVSILDDITLRREQAHRIERLSRVKDMQSSINSAVVRMRERQGLLDEVCRIAVELGGLRAAWVAWYDREAHRLRPAASAGHLDGYLELVRHDPDAPEGAAAGVTIGVLRSGTSVATNDTRTVDASRHRDEALKRGYLSAMHLPLAVGGRTEGVLILYAAERGYFDDEERRLLDELAADVSFALDSLQKSARLDFLAYYDPLTGLPNRGLFHDRLTHSLRQRGGDARLIAVVLLDLERFRQVNETLGRQVGDELLHGVAERLRKAGDSAARVGSDLFGLTLRGARTAAEVNRALEAVMAASFAAPFEVRGEELRVACRAGVAIFPDDGQDADVLMRNAEAALRRSKSSAERVVFYAPDMNARVAESLALENRLRRAVEQRQFVLHYQPKLRLADGALAGAEALIRWQEPGGELVPPGRFIALLEETGLIAEVGRWAVAQAFRDLNAWAASGLRVPRIAVNVSALQLQRQDFVDVVIDEIEGGGDHPDWLELEITESLVMRNVEDSTRKLSILRGMGVAVAIDDFGTGHSSLGYLSRLPVDSLKIDRSFVLGMAGGEQGRNIVTTIIALAGALKLKVVAEGVETEEQAALLRTFGCDEVQGYLFSRPLPAAAMAAFLAGTPCTRGT